MVPEPMTAMRRLGFDMTIKNDTRGKEKKKEANVTKIKEYIHKITNSYLFIHLSYLLAEIIALYISTSPLGLFAPLTTG